MGAQAEAKILVVRDVERDDIEFIAKTLHCLPIAHPDHMRPEKLGHAALVEEVPVSAPILSLQNTTGTPFCPDALTLRRESTLRSSRQCPVSRPSPCCKYPWEPSFHCCSDPA